MANGTAVRYEDIGDQEQVPQADLANYPETHYLAIAKVFPTLQWQRISIPDFVTWLNNVLPLHQDVLDAETARAAIDAALQQEITKGVGRDGRIGTNADNIASLLLRVGALERGTTHSGGSDASGTFIIGLQDVNGVVYNDAQGDPIQSTIAYHGLPSRADNILFPEAKATNDKWFFTLPSGVGVQHIFNEAFGQDRNEDAIWGQSVDTSDDSITYTSTFPLSAGFGGDYSLALTVREAPQEAQDNG